MMEALALSLSLVLALFLINSFLSKVGGGEAGFENVMEGTLAIVFLYLVVISLAGRDNMVVGLPFIDRLSGNMSLTDFGRLEPGLFILECAELISLTFLISYLSQLVPSSFGGSGFTGKTIRNVVLVLLGVAVNHYFLTLMEQTPVYAWAITALQCFIAGTALTVTPAMFIGGLLHMSPQSKPVAFLVEKLPQTKAGKALSTAASNSLVLVFTMMAFESMFGGIASAADRLPAIISLFAPFVLIVLGIRLALRSVLR